MIEKQKKFCSMFLQIREKYYDASDEDFDVLREAFEDTVAELKDSRDSLQKFLLDLREKEIRDKLQFSGTGTFLPQKPFSGGHLR